MFLCDQSPGIMNDSYFNFERSFLENGSSFKKLEYSFLVESTAIEYAPFSCKAVLSKGNVKANRMGSTKWTIANNGVLPITTLFI